MTRYFMDKMNRLKFSSVRKIGIIRLSQLDGLMCAIPAVRALRSAYPDASITLIGLPWAKEFAFRFKKYFHDFMEPSGYPGLAGLATAPGRAMEFLSLARKKKFDLVLQVQDDGTMTNSLARLLEAKQTAGFFGENGFSPHPETFMPYKDKEHEITRLVNLVKFLDLQPQGTELEFPISLNEQKNFTWLMKKFSLSPEKLVCVYPGEEGARGGPWKKPYFAAAGEQLARSGYQVVLAGTSQERNLCKAVAKRMLRPAINLAGLLGLGETGVLLNHGRLLLTGDTGILQIASALKVPSVAVFSRFSDASRWAPLDSKLHITLMATQAGGTQKVLQEILSKA